MDIRCPRCGEPWDNECFHDETSYRNPHKPWMSESGEHNQVTYEKYLTNVRQDFRKRGCVALTSYTDGECEANPRFGIIGDIIDFAGEDSDFAANMIEDAETFGLI